MTAKDLKNALLQEAVQGKLVPQIASEGNARDLLEEIKREKAELVKEGKLKNEKPLPEIKDEDIPFDIPESWCWCRFGDVFQHNTGKTQNSSVETKNGTLRKFITTSNLYWNEFDFTKVKEMLFSENELIRCTVTKGDLLICEGGEYGRSAIWKYDYDVCFQNHVHRARAIKTNSLCAEFYYYLIYLYKNIGLIEGRGVGIKSLSTENLHQIIIPLPPIAEQKRIVNAIEKFSPLIEDYEKKETELTSVNEQIGTLTKKAILQEAVQGKLVPQIDSEGNAKDLLEEIKKEKAKLIKEGKIKKEKTLPEITEDEIPFDIPESWCWCRLGELVDTNIGLTYSPSDIITSGGTEVLRSNNIQNGKIVYDDLVHVSKNVPEKCLSKKGDLLICARNGSKALVGKSALIEQDGMAFGAFMAIVRSPINPYILHFINSPVYRAKLDGVNTTTINQITQDNLRETLFPLPPLAEQKRIVEAIEKMLPLCEKLGE